ncbi:MAG TPA: thiamine phosphate synthase [Lachnospiraceae bacterium]|nr:thiamine phosphate synthase [Lachnospiraceae bacterium]
MCLYAVTDSMWLGNRTLPEVVKEALEGGATFLQIREKNLAYPEFVKLATEVKAVTDAYHIPYVVDDDVELAKEIDADGVHIGQSDLALVEARRVLGPDKIIGVSAHSVAEAIEAEKNGADYLGVGSVFTTSTKLDAEAVSKATLKEICEAVSIPVVAIGGIQKDNMLQLKGTKVDGVAVVSAIFAAPDIQQAAKELRMTADELVSELG